MMDLFTESTNLHEIWPPFIASQLNLLLPWSTRKCHTIFIKAEFNGEDSIMFILSDTSYFFHTVPYMNIKKHGL